MSPEVAEGPGTLLLPLPPRQTADSGRSPLRNTRPEQNSAVEGKRRPMEKKEGGPITSSSSLDGVHVNPEGILGGREAGESKELPSASLILFPALPSSPS